MFAFADWDKVLGQGAERVALVFLVSAGLVCLVSSVLVVYVLCLVLLV